MNLFPLLINFLIMIPSAIFHEYMHGWVADRLGDPTARYVGRLTLNPIPHIDLIGTIIMPIALFLLTGGNVVFAYAKPVPYNPYNLKDQRWGPVWVAIAGPLSNFFLALIFGLMIRWATGAGVDITILLALHTILYVNVLLGVFNLVPIPPLDGSKILFAIMPPSMNEVRVYLERYGFMILLVFVFFLFRLIVPIILFIHRLFAGSLPLWVG